MACSQYLIDFMLTGVYHSSQPDKLLLENLETVSFYPAVWIDHLGMLRNVLFNR